MEELKNHVKFYREKREKICLTITRHSLGGALALLNAVDEAAASLPDLLMDVTSFDAPRILPPGKRSMK